MCHIFVWNSVARHIQMGEKIHLEFIYENISQFCLKVCRDLTL